MENYIYKGDRYSLEIGTSAIRVYQDGVRVTDLMPATSVGTVTELDGEFTENEEHGERTPAAIEKISDGEFLWKGTSDLWNKEYRLSCDREGFTYSVTLKGKGRVGKVDYFSAHLEDSDYTCSDYNFCEYFIPCGGTDPAFRNIMPAALPYRSFFELLIPPPYCFSFRTEGLDGRFGLGMCAKDGEYNFFHFDYNLGFNTRRRGFYLSTALDGHTAVDGEFTLPVIRAFFGDDDLDIVRKYSAYHFDTGLCRKNERKDIPRWWRGPIVCGWNEQEMLITDGCSQAGMARQDAYMKIADMIKDHNIRPTMLIIDDKWQKTYGDCLPDPERWPDMRAFTDEMHSRGIHTILWFRLWGGEGLPEDEVMTGEGIPYRSFSLNYPPYADPTNEKYRAHLKKILHYLLSDEEGCMNCDGFKLDYSLIMPYGKSAKSAGGKYGAQMTKELYNLIYSTAKEIKPDALINASPCHPYFDEVCDQARLHDYSWDLRNETETMGLRAKLFEAAMPGVLIDTDSVNFANHDDAMRFYRNMPKIGIPDIYRFSDDPAVTFTDEDWVEIEAMMNAYSDEMDEKYGK